jgi:hypothetical protein
MARYHSNGNYYRGNYSSYNHYHNNNYRPQQRSYTPPKVQYVVTQAPQPQVDPWKGLGARIVEGSIIAAIGTLINGVTSVAVEAMNAKTAAQLAELEPKKPDYTQGADGKWYDSYGNLITPKEQLPK